MSTDNAQTEAPQNPQELTKTWLARIEGAKKALERWHTRGERIERIYRAQGASSDAADDTEQAAKFNVFWSNVEVLGPATYSRRPKVEVFRRFYDQDPVGRLAGLILERGLQYEIDCRNDLHATLKAAVKDRLLPGLGMCWVRYEPSFTKKAVTLPHPDDPTKTQDQEVESLADEWTAVDYVFWKDFLPSPARTWADMRWAGRWVLFSEEALKTRFGEATKKFGGDISKVSINIDPAEPSKDEGAIASKEDTSTKRAGVYEIWDKDSNQILWFSKGYDYPLDIRPNLPNFEDFFPCPRPLMATTSNSKFEPVPDYIYYQEQIRELDSVTRRINTLVGSLRLIGVYDANNSDLQTLLSGGFENRMVPVNSWAAFAEKGGLKGVVDFLPLEQVIKTLTALYEAREQLKQSVYEITGMADIVRGASVASETLGAQQIKAKFANLRLSSRQQQVAEFVTQVLRLKAELMCAHYAPETLVRISSCEQLPEVKADLEAQAKKLQQQQLAQMQQQAGQQAMAMGQQPPPPQQLPPPQPSENPMDSPLVQKAVSLLRDQRIRKYRIEVASDSMIELDEVDERTRRNEFMSNLANFFNGMKNVTALGPEMIPVALEMLKFVVRGFSVGRVLEGTIEEAIFKMQARMAKPPQPQVPEPVQVAQLRDKGDTARLQLELASKEKIAALEHQAKMQQTMSDQKHEAVMSRMQQVHADQQAHADRFLQAQQLQGEASQAQAQSQTQALEGVLKQILVMLQQEQKEDSQEEQQLQALSEAQQAVQKSLEELLIAVKAPRQRKPVYDPISGDISHIEDVVIQ